MRELTQSEKVSKSLIGRFGELARRWKGEDAGYTAKHLWIVKHHGKASMCDECGTKNASRYEWSNISGEYKRDRSDYRQLCPSCHRKIDQGNYCRKGHEYTPENTYVRKEGWRVCKSCHQEAHKKWRLKCQGQ